jgi:hypothetical protein
MRPTISIAAVLLLAVLAVPAVAAPSSPSPADLAFLESLAGSQPLPPELGVPQPVMKACNVSVECGDGNVAACTGNANCQTTIAGVKCDGVEHQCPNFCTIGQSCQCCSGWYNGFCWSRSGDCEYTDNGIACNGHEITCEQSCPLCPEW